MTTTVPLALLLACGAFACGESQPVAAVVPPAARATTQLPPPAPLPAGGRFAKAEHAVGEAETLLDAGDLVAAGKALDDALVLDPMNRQALIVRGRILIGQQRAAEAIASFQSARRRTLDVLASEWIGLGYLALRDERLAAGDAGSGLGPAELAESARAAFEEVVRLDPGNGNARHNMGYCSRLAGRLDESVTILQALVAEQPERVRTLYELGVSLQAAGRNEEARAVLQRLLGIQPEHGAARQAMDKLVGEEG